MIAIGEICPLFFNPIKNKFQQDIDYIQRFYTTDNIVIQAISDSKSDSVFFYLKDLISGATKRLSSETYEVNSSTTLHYIHISGLADSVYMLSVVEETNSDVYESEPFAVCSDQNILQETCLFQYSNEDNNSPFANIFSLSMGQQLFEFRVEAGFKPGGISFNVSNEQFRNQRQEIIELYSFPYDTYKLTCGDASGVPYWIISLINKVLSLSCLIIDGERYVRSGNSVPEMSQISEDGQMFNAEIAIEKNSEQYLFVRNNFVKVASKETSVAIDVISNGIWSADVLAGDFISFDWQGTRKGNGTLVLNIEGNKGEARNGIVKLSTQSGAECYLLIYQEDIISISISPTGVQYIPKEGKELTMHLSSNIEYWSVGYLPSWMEMTPISGGEGEYDISVKVHSNSGQSSREDCIQIEGANSEILAEIPFSQTGLSTAIIPDTLSFPASVDVRSVKLLSSASWTKKSGPQWIVVNPTKGDEGETEIRVMVLGNPKTEEREGEVVFSQVDTDVTVTLKVIQAAKEAAPAIVVTPDTLTFSPATGLIVESKEVTVSSTGNWSATSDTNFFQIYPTSGTAGDTKVTIAVVENNTEAQREADVVFDDGEGFTTTLHVIQEGKTLPIVLEPNSLSYSANSVSGAEMKTIKVTATGAWKVAYSADWMLVAPLEGGIGETEVRIAVGDNKTGENREAEIAFLDNNNFTAYLEIFQSFD